MPISENKIKDGIAKQGQETKKMSIRNMTDVINEYKIINVKLKQHAKHIPLDEKKYLRENIIQDKLLDQQQALLMEARNMEIEGLQDISSMIRLWHLDVIQQIKSNRLPESQLLVLCVHEYLEGNMQNI